MKYDFVKLDPAQNMTIIVKNPVPRAEQARVAEALMSYGSVYAEQVGFIEPVTLPGARTRLQMMGGEFCGNAAMCAAALAARDAGIAPGDDWSMPIEMSGAEGVTQCRVSAKDTHFRCRVEMPLPIYVDVSGDINLVRMPGITHAVIFADDFEDMRAGAPDMLRKLAAAERAEAVGLILYSRALRRIAPLVYVKGAESMVWEHGCGSGTAAVGALEAFLSGACAQLTIAQPGGEIAVSAAYNGGGISKLCIESCVRIVAEGCAYV